MVDSYHRSVGVRTVKVDGIEFLIKDEPFSFRGFGKHEDIAAVGRNPRPLFRRGGNKRRAISETTNGNPLSARLCFQQDGDYVPHF